MNTSSAECVRFPFPFPEGAGRKPGEFCWGRETSDGIRYLYIVLPGSLTPDAIRVVRGRERGGSLGDYVWGWDGNEDKPTLTPSLLWPERWHGFLTAGRLVSC